VLRVLAVVSALGFLTLVMVQASAFYAPPPPPAPKTHYDMVAPSTKDAPVVFPPDHPAYLGASKSLTVVPPKPLVDPRKVDHRAYLGATKAGILGPLKVSEEPAPAPQQQGPHPR
jgi:hypothetical protein